MKIIHENNVIGKDLHRYWLIVLMVNKYVIMVNNYIMTEEGLVMSELIVIASSKDLMRFTDLKIDCSSD